MRERVLALGRAEERGGADGSNGPFVRGNRRGARPFWRLQVRTSRIVENTQKSLDLFYNIQVSLLVRLRPVEKVAFNRLRAKPLTEQNKLIPHNIHCTNLP